jgi:peptide/nickel transport system permease protein
MRYPSSFGRYFALRLALAVPTVWVILTLVFLFMRVAPGNPIEASVGAHLTPEELHAREVEAGLTDPLWVQYLRYVGGIFHGDFGTTITDQRSVTSIVVQNGGATLELTVAAFVFALLVAVVFGVVAAVKRDRWQDIVCRLAGIAVYATPVFFSGFLLQIVFGSKLNWLPTSGQASAITTYTLRTRTHIYFLDAILSADWGALRDVALHLVLPTVALGLLMIGIFVRLVRVNVVQTLQGDYVEAARARGVESRKVVVSHALRNALVPVATLAGLQFAHLLSGAVLTEVTFNWPGLGFELLRYLQNRDYTAVQGLITFYALVVVAISICVDLVVARIDPRVRYG